MGRHCKRNQDTVGVSGSGREVGSQCKRSGKSV